MMLAYIILTLEIDLDLIHSVDERAIAAKSVAIITFAPHTNLKSFFVTPH